MGKATIIFVISACLSVRMEQFGSRWMDFQRIWYMRNCQKSVEKIQISLKSDMTIMALYMTTDYVHFSQHLTEFFLEWEISLLIKIQPDATVCRYSFTEKSLYMFWVSHHPSSGVLKTVTATSGTGHNIGTATSLQRGPIWPRWREVAAAVLWPVPEVAVTVFSTPDDGCCDTGNM